MSALVLSRFNHLVMINKYPLPVSNCPIIIKMRVETQVLHCFEIITGPKPFKINLSPFFSSKIAQKFKSRSSFILISTPFESYFIQIHSLPHCDKIILKYYEIEWIFKLFLYGENSLIPVRPFMITSASLRDKNNE